MLIICKICNLELNGLKGLSSHLKRKHKMSTNDYYDQFLKAESEGFCLTCSNPTKFYKFQQGYRLFCTLKCQSKYRKQKTLDKRKEREAENPINCELCDRRVDSWVGLSKHISIHNIGGRDYYDQYLKKEDEGFCLNCEVETRFVNLRIGYKKFCGHTCKLQGKFNPRFGKHCTDETKAKIGKANSIEKKLIGCLNCGEKIEVRVTSKRKFCGLSCRTSYRNKMDNPMLNDEARLKMAETQKEKFVNPENHPMFGKKHTPESKNIMSKKAIDKIMADGGVHKSYWRSITGVFYSEKNQKDIWYGSSYELRAYKILELQKHVKSYGRCDFYLEYSFEGSKHRYHPDLFVEYSCGENEFIEIKPEAKLKDKKVQAKIRVAKKYAKQNDLNFSVWTEKDLTRMEV